MSVVDSDLRRRHHVGTWLLLTTTHEWTVAMGGDRSVRLGARVNLTFGAVLMMSRTGQC